MPGKQRSDLTLLYPIQQIISIDSNQPETRKFTDKGTSTSASLAQSKVKKSEESISRTRSSAQNIPEPHLQVVYTPSTYIPLAKHQPCVHI